MRRIIFSMGAERRTRRKGFHSMGEGDIGGDE